MRPYFPVAYKLALVFGLLITAGMVSLGLIIAHDQTQLLERQTSEFSATVVRQTAESAKDPLLANDALGLQVIVNNLATQSRVLGAAIYSEEMRPLVQSGAVPPVPLAITAATRDAPVDWSRYGTAEHTDSVSFLAPVIVRGVKAGFALVTFDRSFMEQAKRKTIRTVAGVTILLVLLGIVISMILSRRLTRPISKLMQASRAISAGNYTVSFSQRPNDELGILMQSLMSMSEGLVRKEQVEAAFSRYVSPKVAKEVLNDVEPVRLGGKHVEASVLFADIVGFTGLSETMEPAEISRLLNEYFSYIAKVAHTTHAYIDKFIGDCVMLVFGVPQPDKQHRFHAVVCAVMIQQLVERLNERRRAQGQPTVDFRIGVNSGGMLAGNMGAADRMDYTVVGDSVNLASRLSSAATAGCILVSTEFHDAPDLAGRLVSAPYGKLELRGKKEQVDTYCVTDVAEKYRPAVQAQLSRILDDAVTTA